MRGWVEDGWLDMCTNSPVGMPEYSACWVAGWRTLMGVNRVVWIAGMLWRFRPRHVLVRAMRAGGTSGHSCASADFGCPTWSLRLLMPRGSCANCVGWHQVDDLGTVGIGG